LDNAPIDPPRHSLLLSHHWLKQQADFTTTGGTLLCSLLIGERVKVLREAPGSYFPVPHFPVGKAFNRKMALPAPASCG
jgi:hypothetical protein